MKSFLESLRMTTNRQLLVVLTVGFAITALEARLLHQGVVSENAAAWIPTIASGVGAVACILALINSIWARRISTAVLTIVMACSMVGMYLHTEFKPSAFASLFGQATVVAPQLEERSTGGEDEDERPNRTEPKGKGEKESTPPALAPLSIAGLALIGLIAIRSKSTVS
jgi:hypothetical protein